MTEDGRGGQKSRVSRSSAASKDHWEGTGEGEPMRIRRGKTKPWNKRWVVCLSRIAQLAGDGVGPSKPRSPLL